MPARHAARRPATTTRRAFLAGAAGTAAAAAAAVAAGPLRAGAADAPQTPPSTSRWSARARRADRGPKPRRRGPLGRWCSRRGTGSAAALSTTTSAAGTSPRQAASSSGRRRTGSSRWPPRSASARSTRTTPATTCTSTRLERLKYSDTGLLGTAPPDPLLIADIAVLSQHIDRWPPSRSRRGAVDGAERRRRRTRMTLETWVRANSINANGILGAARAVHSRRCSAPSPATSPSCHVLAYVARAGDADAQGHASSGCSTCAAGRSRRGSSAGRSWCRCAWPPHLGSRVHARARRSARSARRDTA